jgi:hypothetical protein
MKVFTDATETSFFKTDNHLKNLHEIEINSIEDFVFRYSLDSDILLGIKCWMVNRFDELLPGLPYTDLSDEPELYGEWLEIDFVKGMSYLDCLFEISKYESIVDSMEKYQKSGIFESVEQEWINDNDEKWTITYACDLSKKPEFRSLEVISESNNNVTTRIIENGY